MALTETTKVDQIEVVGDHTIQVRTATIIEKDGIEISKSFHRHIVSAGDDVTNEDPKVRAIANAIWTEEIIAQYRQSLSDSISNQQ
jgi:hypothetical protein